MKERKIILFLVEGKSDKTALEFGFQEVYETRNVEFEWLRGDITSDEHTTKKNVEKIIVDKIDKLLAAHMEFNAQDILKVIQIVDTDGAFIPVENVKQATNRVTSYTEEFIYAKDKTRLVTRNIRKRNILHLLKNKEYIEKIDEKGNIKYRLNYQVFFFSRNLEHALYNMDGDYDDDKKKELAFDFSDEYEGKPEEFKKHLKCIGLKSPGNYQKSWDYIFSGINSLHRGSNLHLIFEDATLEN